MAISTVINRSAATVISSTVLSLSSGMTWGGYYTLLTLINMLSIAFVFYIVPETKGKTLEEMLAFFESIASPGHYDQTRGESEDSDESGGIEMSPKYDMTSIVPLGKNSGEQSSITHTIE